jgi:opacity protein-like surface antigen
MEKRFSYLFLLLLLVFNSALKGQISSPKTMSDAGVFSLGVRSTLSLFDHDGSGLGSGGQFRIQFNKRVNSDWFADYISINISDKVRSDYLHVGWSVLYYPAPELNYPKLLKPYILAGHCFDYNKKTAINDPMVSLNRWGSAVQAGLGTHFNLSERFDVSLTCQYMIHLTKSIEADIQGELVNFHQHNSSALEGHLLSTISLNYKLFKLWNR